MIRLLLCHEFCLNILGHIIGAFCGGQRLHLVRSLMFQRHSILSGRKHSVRVFAYVANDYLVTKERNVQEWVMCTMRKTDWSEK